MTLRLVSKDNLYLFTNSIHVCITLHYTWYHSMKLWNFTRTLLCGCQSLYLQRMKINTWEIHTLWFYNYLCNQCLSPLIWVRILSGRDHMVVGFTTTFAIWCCKFESRKWLATGRVYDFLWVLWFPPLIKLIATIYLKYVESRFKHHSLNPNI